MQKQFEVVGLTRDSRSVVIRRHFDVRTDALHWRNQLLLGRCTYAIVYDLEKNAPILDQ